MLLTFSPTNINAMIRFRYLDATETVCRITINDIVFSGRSKRNPKDTFNKKLGRYYAFKRALSTIPDKDVRTVIAKQFLSTYKLPQKN